MELEARRCLDLGLKGFVLPDTPERLGIPSFLHDYWTPLLEMCADRGVPINFHLNAAMDPNALTWEGFAFEQTLSVVATMFSIGNAATLGNWIVSGRLDRHPKLKIGLIESGLGWVLFALEALEHQFDEMLPSKSKMLQRRPWDYFRDQFWVTYWFESIGPKLLQEHIVDTLGGYDQNVRKRVLERNAVELYNLPF